MSRRSLCSIDFSELFSVWYGCWAYQIFGIIKCQQAHHAVVWIRMLPFGPPLVCLPSSLNLRIILPMSFSPRIMTRPNHHTWCYLILSLTYATPICPDALIPTPIPLGDISLIPRYKMRISACSILLSCRLLTCPSVLDPHWPGSISSTCHQIMHDILISVLITLNSTISGIWISQPFEWLFSD